MTEGLRCGWKGTVYMGTEEKRTATPAEHAAPVLQMLANDRARIEVLVVGMSPEKQTEYLANVMAAERGVESLVAQVERTRYLEMQIKGLRCADCTCPNECGATIAPFCRFKARHDTERVQRAEAALREIEMKPYRAEEVISRYRAESQL